MNNKSLIFKSILAVSIIFGPILFNSCSKDEPLQQKTEVTTDVTIEDQKLEQQIIEFRNKLNSTEKSSEQLEQDDAAWYLDAVVNYSYTFPHIEYNSFSNSSSIVTMEVSDNSVNFTELVSAYNKIEGVLRTHFFGMDDENKHLSTISVIKTENSTENLIEFEIRSTIGVYGTNEPGDIQSPTDDPFDDDDWWMWGYEYGKCGDYSGYEGTDAAEQISFAIRRHYNTSNIRYYYLDPLVIPTPIYPGDRGVDYEWLFFAPDTEYCLSPDVMNHYFYQSFNVIDHFDPNDGRVLKNYWLQGDLLSHTILHRIDILEYGEKHRRTVPPHDLTEG